MIVYNSKHQQITLEEKPFSSGGEGEVYKISSPSSKSDTYCVKLYYENKRTDDRHRKIEFMVNNPPQVLEKNGTKIGWPVDLVFLNNSFAGFVMPLAFPDSKKLSILIGLNLRNNLDPIWRKFDRKLGRYALVARLKLINNISIPIFLLHNTGKYVFQDFKPDNVLITHNGRVTLCDMDSIQISNGGKLMFPGTAATLEYAPPEYHNKNVGKTQDKPVTKSWDNFTIAVVFYQLLFGIHPFAVTPKDLPEGESNDLSSNIANGLFPFGSRSNKIAVIPKPHEKFNLVPPELQSYFRSAFSFAVNMRPGAQAWGELVHKYICSAGDVPRPESVPDPKTTTSSAPKPPKPKPKPSQPKPKPSQPKPESPQPKPKSPQPKLDTSSAIEEYNASLRHDKFWKIFRIAILTCYILGMLVFTIYLIIGCM